MPTQYYQHTEVHNQWQEKVVHEFRTIERNFRCPRTLLQKTSRLELLQDLETHDYRHECLTQQAPLEAVLATDHPQGKNHTQEIAHRQKL